MAKLNVCQSAISDVTHQTIIMGDFNLDWLEELTPARMTAWVLQAAIVSEVTTDYASALDHVYTNIPADQIQCYTAESYFSDHKPVIVSVQFQQY